MLIEFLKTLRSNHKSDVNRAKKNNTKICEDVNLFDDEFYIMSLSDIKKLYNKAIHSDTKSKDYEAFMTIFPKSNFLVFFIDNYSNKGDEKLYFETLKYMKETLEEKMNQGISLNGYLIPYFKIYSYGLLGYINYASSLGKIKNDIVKFYEENIKLFEFYRGDMFDIYDCLNYAYYGASKYSKIQDLFDNKPLMRTELSYYLMALIMKEEDVSLNFLLKAQEKNPYVPLIITGKIPFGLIMPFLNEANLIPHILNGQAMISNSLRPLILLTLIDKKVCHLDDGFNDTFSMIGEDAFILRNGIFNDLEIDILIAAYQYLIETDSYLFIEKSEVINILKGKTKLKHLPKDLKLGVYPNLNKDVFDFSIKALEKYNLVKGFGDRFLVHDLANIMIEMITLEDKIIKECDEEAKSYLEKMKLEDDESEEEDFKEDIKFDA